MLPQRPFLYLELARPVLLPMDPQPILRASLEKT